ncbi:MAG TPA: signal peptidase I [Ideonella sp.]|nr:signal peptidase I [Ideonella sp.]
MKRWLKDNRGLLVFLLCFGVFRTAVADWNPIPSGSMRPTILEGDVVLVNRLAYDLKIPITDISLLRLGEPRRGDVVTFSSPRDGTRLIKRIVAVPGDVVQMRNEVLAVNGQAAVYAETTAVSEALGPGIEVPALKAVEQLAGSRRTVQFFPGAGGRSSFGPLVVPPGSYFMLGDNRDNSEDSRYIGMVPRHLLIGRAHRIVVSADIGSGWQPRWARFAQALR